MELNGPI